MLSLVLLSLISTAAASDPKVEPARLTVAVAPFISSSDEEYRWLGLGVAQALSAQLLEVKEINTVTVRQLNSAVRKDNLKPDELSDEKVATHLGTQLGADVVIIGTYTASWPDVTFVARILRVKTGKAEKAEFFPGHMEDFFALEKDVAKDLFSKLGLRGEPSQAAIGTKNLYAYHQAMVGYELLNWQSMSPRSDITLPQGSIRKAKVHFEKALSLDPNFADAHAGVGQAHTFLGDYEAARRAFAQALTVSPGGFNSQAVIGRYYADLRSGRTDDALKGLDAGQKARPGFLLALGYLGETYNHMGRHREALSVFERYKKADPQQPWVMIQLGYTKARLKRFDDAIADTKTAVAMLPDSNSFKVELASRYIDAEKFTDAEEVVRKALEKSPKHPTLNVRLGYIYLLQNKCDAAVPVLEKALQEGQGTDMVRTRQLAHYDLARCMALRKDNNRALSHLEDAVKNGFKDLDDLENEEDLEPLRKDARFQKIMDLARKPHA